MSAQLIEDLKGVRDLLKEVGTLVQGGCQRANGEKTTHRDPLAVKFDMFGAIFKVTGTNQVSLTSRAFNVSRALRKAGPAGLYTENKHYTYEVAMAILTLAILKAEHFPDEVWS